MNVSIESSPSSATIAKDTSIAFASYVDRNYLPGFETLLKSLILTNPWFNLPYIVFTDELDHNQRIGLKRLYKKISFRTINKDIYSQIKKTETPKAHNAYLIDKAYYFFEAFQIYDYEKVVFLDDDLLFLKDISPVLSMPGHVIATEAGGDNEDGKELNSGFVIMNGAEWRRKAFDGILEIGIAGNYILDRHDQALISAYLDGNYTRLPWQFNATKRRFVGADSIPDDLRVIHYVGKKKPWNAQEKGYAFLDSLWHAANHPTKKFYKIAAKRCTDYHNLELAEFYIKAGIEAKVIDWKIARGLINAFIKCNHIEEAQSFISALQMNKSPQSLLSRALICFTAGKYLEAEALLLNSIDNNVNVADALVLLTNLTWTTRRYEQSRLYLRECFLRAPLTPSLHGIAKKIEFYDSLEKEKIPDIELLQKKDAFALVGAVMPHNTNAGDEMAADSSRQAFAHARPGQRWNRFFVHQSYEDREVDYLNLHRAIIVGGSGLFMTDTGANRNSGWQWNISHQNLKRLTSPLVVFGVGYNRFERQEDFSSHFSDSLKIVMEKSVFFGLRNYGSCEAIKKYLPQEQWDRIQFQPCPTTVIRHTYPEYFQAKRERKNVYLNVALDRPVLRFGDEYNDFVHELSQTIKHLQSRGENVVYVAHTPSDSRFILDIARQEELYLPMLRLFHNNKKNAVREMIELYRDSKLVIGMRGHATLIPIGCGTPVVALSSHPKVSYNIIDMGLEQWLVSAKMLSHSFLNSRIDAILDNYESAEKLALDAGDRMFEITQNNIQSIYRAIDEFWA